MDRLRKLDLVGLVLLLAAFLVYRIRSFWTPGLTALSVIGAILIVVSLVARWDDIRASLRRPSTRFGANSATSVLLLLGILGFVNYLGVRNDVRWDLTSEKRFTLAEQSREILGELDQDVHIRAFYSGVDPAVENLLNLYSAASPRISFEFIDPDVQPQLASQYEVTVYGMVGNPLTGGGMSMGTLILETDLRRERVEADTAPATEQDITNAVIKLVKGETKKIYFIGGHGEKAVDDTTRAGLETARQALERENYEVQGLNLVEEGAVPEDARVLVWAGPRVEPFTEEVDLIDAWLHDGGSLFVMLDPPPEGAALDELLGRWSVSAGDDFVVDVSGLGQLLGAGPEVPVVTDYTSTHAITRDFGLMTLFPMVRSLAADPEADPEAVVTPILSTSARSWGETQLGTAEVGFDEGVDQEGPVNIGLAVTRPFAEERTARLVVIGDSDFPANSFFALQGNGDLFLNSVSWLAEDEGFISIRPREPDDRPLILTEAEARISYYFSLVLFPLGVLVAGLAVWVRRRKQ